MNLLLHSLYSPFFLFFWGSVLFWAVCGFRLSGKKRLWKLYGIGLLVIALLSSSAGNRLLHWSLVAGLDKEFNQARNLPEGSAPVFLLVAAGGYLIMPDPREDVLSTLTALRVAAAANVFTHYPEATLVMQGTGRLVVQGDKEVRPAQRQGELMAQLAISLGVPAESILLETESRNSREHLWEILSFPGVNRETPIGVVSADWHIRRLRQVFASDFTTVWFFPAGEPPELAGGLASFWPNEGSLTSSRLYLREWGAIVWYALGGRSR